jgi:hypothetical protein
MRETNSPPPRNAQCAVDLTNLGGFVFPCRANKHPLTPNGHLDATNDIAIILAWWARWPYADPGLRPSNSYFVLDIDRKTGCDGFKDFLALEGREALDVDTPVATTPGGGLHLYFRTGGARFANRVRLNGWGLDIRGSDGYVVAPAPGNGRCWLRPPTGPWKSAPEWLRRENETHEARGYDPETPVFGADFLSALSPSGRYCGDTAHGAAALNGACDDIRRAVRGTRDHTLNAKFYKIGCLIAEGELGPHAAEVVLEAGLTMLDPLPEEIVREKAERVIARVFRFRRGGRGLDGIILLCDGSCTSYSSAVCRQSEIWAKSARWFQ